MELTVDQALQQGIAAHKEGKLQDAERLYRAILEAQPTHPHANHNLGVLAMAVNKPHQAIPLFKLALETNPRIEQFWLSYVDALVKLQRFDEAGAVLRDCEQANVSSEMLDALALRLQVNMPDSSADAEKGQALQEKKQKLPKRTKAKNSKIQDSPLSERPSQNLVDRLLKAYEAGEFAEAEVLATRLTEQFPADQFGWKALGAILKQAGRLNASLRPMLKSVELSPNDYEAHYNLGVVLSELGKFDEAATSFKCAARIKPESAEVHNNLGNTLRVLGKLAEAETSFGRSLALRPDYAEAHNNLGVALQGLGEFDKAEASYRRAINFRPGFAAARYNLGVLLAEIGNLDEAAAMYREAIDLRPSHANGYLALGSTLLKLGRRHEAIKCYSQAIAFKPDFGEAYFGLGLAVSDSRFSRQAPQLYRPLLQMLTAGDFARPADVAVAITSLLRHEPLLKELLVKNSDAMSLEEAEFAIERLQQFPLLHQLMRICPLPDLQFETLFSSIRRLVLQNLGYFEVSEQLIYFLSTLALHCAVNEYVYAESDEEAYLVEKLEEKVKEAIQRSEQPNAVTILSLATYRRLYQYDWYREVDALSNLAEVKKSLIEEPYIEELIARDIPSLEIISDDTSLRVRGQYEENPYPRWIKTAIPTEARSIDGVCSDLNLNLHCENIKGVIAPRILIAGCGTGQHSITTACRFANCQVTAVDLSRASLAYAHRKTIGLGINNIKYLHADILHLKRIEQKFDIIESSGVLHHMDDPFAGWKVLVDVLAPGGLLKIGLYSEVARQNVVAVRKEIAELEVGTSDSEIRGFRDRLAASSDENHQDLTTLGDFYSLSNFRDLVFHVQEHRFSLLQIRAFLEEIGLHFCGFEMRDGFAEFKKFFGEEADVCDLLLWQQFEHDHPKTFAGMYQFWCQKI